MYKAWWYLVFGAIAVPSAYANVNADDIQYFLTNNQVRFQQIRAGELAGLGINSDYDVKVLSHGWIDNVDSSWYEPTKNNFLRRGTTIIAIDWSRHAGGLYSTAVSRLEAVANHVADKLMKISDEIGVPLSRFHLIGHSLGAHLFGFAGKRVWAVRRQLIGRITGLDPAGPSFSNRDPSRRLSPDDAIFVDNIHTDSAVAGIGQSIGHVDFYPNGGSRQNGCIIVGCSHNRAPLFFYESILSDGFVSVQCPSRSDFNNGRCNNNLRTFMGENVDQMLRGDFHLNTNRRAPFAMYRL